MCTYSHTYKGQYSREDAWDPGRVQEKVELTNVAMLIGNTRTWPCDPPTLSSSSSFCSFYTSFSSVLKLIDENMIHLFFKALPLNGIERHRYLLTSTDSIKSTYILLYGLVKYTYIILSHFENCRLMIE